MNVKPYQQPAEQESNAEPSHQFRIESEWKKELGNAQKWGDLPQQINTEKTKKPSWDANDPERKEARNGKRNAGGDEAFFVNLERIIKTERKTGIFIQTEWRKLSHLDSQQNKRVMEKPVTSLEGVRIEASRTESSTTIRPPCIVNRRTLLAEGVEGRRRERGTGAERLANQEKETTETQNNPSNHGRGRRKEDAGIYIVTDLLATPCGDPRPGGGLRAGKRERATGPTCSRTWIPPTVSTSHGVLTGHLGQSGALRGAIFIYIFCSAGPAESLQFHPYWVSSRREKPGRPLPPNNVFNTIQLHYVGQAGSYSPEYNDREGILPF